MNEDLFNTVNKMLENGKDLPTMINNQLDSVKNNKDLSEEDKSNILPIVNEIESMMKSEDTNGLLALIPKLKNLRNAD